MREIRDTTFVLKPDFRMPYTQGHPFGLTPRGAIWVPPRHPGLLIRGCQIIGWSDRWLDRWSSDHPKWIGVDGSSRPLQELSGITADQVDGLTIEDVQIERMPGAGVYLAAVRDASIQRVVTRRCFTAVHLEYFSPASEERPKKLPRRLSSDVLIDGCIAIDNWGVSYPRRSEDYRDIYDPDECIGSMGFYLYSAERLTVRRCMAIGSMKGGLKFGHCKDALIEDFYGRSILSMGSLYWSDTRGAYQTETMAGGTVNKPLLSENIRIVNATLARGASLTPPNLRLLAARVRVATSQPGEDRRRPHLGAESAGHRIHPGLGRRRDRRARRDVPWAQARRRAHARVRGLFSIGDYGAPRSLPSSVNADLLTVNEWRASD